MQNKRLLNGQSLPVPLLDIKLGERSSAHDLGRFPNTQRVIKSTVQYMLTVT